MNLKNLTEETEPVSYTPTYQPMYSNMIPTSPTSIPSTQNTMSNQYPTQMPTYPYMVPNQQGYVTYPMTSPYSMPMNYYGGMDPNYGMQQMPNQAHSPILQPHNGMPGMMPGQPLYYDYNLGNQERCDPGDPISNIDFNNTSKNGTEEANLFVFHLPNSMSNIELYELFKPYGTILSLKIMIDKRTGRSKGYGFVCYDSKVAANEAIFHLHGQKIGRKRIKVELKKDKRKIASNNNNHNNMMNYQQQQQHQQIHHHPHHQHQQKHYPIDNNIYYQNNNIKDKAENHYYQQQQVFQKMDIIYPMGYKPDPEVPPFINNKNLNSNESNLIQNEQNFIDNNNIIQMQNKRLHELRNYTNSNIHSNSASNETSNATTPRDSPSFSPKNLSPRNHTPSNLSPRILTPKNLTPKNQSPMMESNINNLTQNIDRINLNDINIIEQN